MSEVSIELVQSRHSDHFPTFFVWNFNPGTSVQLQALTGISPEFNLTIGMQSPGALSKLDKYRFRDKS